MGWLMTAVPGVPIHDILVVDGDTHPRWALARALELEGYRVLTAETGEGALEALAGRHIDLVVTELRLPGMGGFELLEWAKENRPGTGVIVTTGAPSADARKRARDVGAFGCLEKPLDLVAVCEFVNRLLRPPRFAGRVSDIDLLDYLQLLATTRKSKTILVGHGQATGWLVFDEGRIVHAECGDLAGVEALNELTSWEDGVFIDLPYTPPEEVSIRDSTAYLLMEAARQRDERLQAGLPHGEKDAMTPSRGTGETRAESQEDEPEAEQTFSDLRARYQAFLEGLAGTRCVEAATLVSKAGLTFARSGPLPSGADELVVALHQVQAKVGAALGLEPGAAPAVTLYDVARRAVHVRSAGAHILGVWLGADADIDLISRSVEAHGQGLP